MRLARAFRIATSLADAYVFTTQLCPTSVSSLQPIFEAVGFGEIEARERVSRAFFVCSMGFHKQRRRLP